MRFVVSVLYGLGVLAASACATETPDADAGADREPVHVTGNVVVDVQDLTALAGDLRRGRAGGVPAAIFVGSVTPPIEPGAPVRLDAGGYWLEYGTEVATVAVVDDLGWTLEQAIQVSAGDGSPPRITDSDGNELSGRVTGYYPPRDEQKLMTGQFVLFVIVPPTREGWTLMWRADLAGDWVSGVGTVAGTDVSLDSLRF